MSGSRSKRDRQRRNAARRKDEERLRRTQQTATGGPPVEERAPATVVALDHWTSVGQDEPVTDYPDLPTKRTLQRIDRAARGIEEAEAALIEAVRAARKDGHTWSSIAMVLGITVQSAHSRFRHRLVS